MTTQQKVLIFGAAGAVYVMREQLGAAFPNVFPFWAPA